MTISIKPTASGSTIEQDGSTVVSIESDRSVDIDSGTLHVDATNNRVGIGTSSPSVNLHLKGNSFANAIRWEETGGNNNFYSGPIDSSGNFGIDNNSSSGYIRFATNSAERMRIDSNGRVTIPNQPAFLVGYNSNTNLTVATGDKVTFNQKNFDNNNNFDTTNSRFTAPVTGKYRLAASFQSDTSQNGRPSYRKNGSDFVITTDAVQSTSYITSAANYQMTLILDIVMPLNAGDYVEIWQRTGGGTLAYYAGHSYWNGYLIG